MLVRVTLDTWGWCKYLIRLETETACFNKKKWKKFFCFQINLLGCRSKLFQPEKKQEFRNREHSWCIKETEGSWSEKGRRFKIELENVFPAYNLCFALSWQCFAKHKLWMPCKLVFLLHVCGWGSQKWWKK